MAKFSISECVACKVLGQHRPTQRKRPGGRPGEEALTADIIRLASRYGRYGYRRITAMLRCEGWTVNAKRVERIWRREGLEVPQKQPKRGRLWLNDGSCIRLRPEHTNHVWSYDFVEGRSYQRAEFELADTSLHPSRSRSLVTNHDLDHRFASIRRDYLAMPRSVETFRASKTARRQPKSCDG